VEVDDLAHRTSAKIWLAAAAGLGRGGGGDGRRASGLSTTDESLAGRPRRQTARKGGLPFVRNAHQLPSLRTPCAEHHYSPSLSHIQDHHGTSAFHHHGVPPRARPGQLNRPRAPFVQAPPAGRGRGGKFKVKRGGGRNFSRDTVAVEGEDAFNKWCVPARQPLAVLSSQLEKAVGLRTSWRD
jgi:hypothetical protein